MKKPDLEISLISETRMHCFSDRSSPFTAPRDLPFDFQGEFQAASLTAYDQEAAERVYL